jgi:cytochrome b
VTARAAAAGADRPLQPVWDRLVRALHLTLIAAVAVSALSLAWPIGLHRAAGWVAAAAVLLRVGWGVVGPRRARFTSFVLGPAATFGYAGAVLRGRAPRHLGHNPLGGWMVVALLADVAGLALTGWLYTTDRWWGDATVEAVHLALAWALLALVALHVTGALATGRAHRENLVRAMVTGKKPAARPGDID